MARLLNWLLAGALFAIVGAVELGAQSPVDFARDVRSILSDRCFICHGPDAAKRRGDLRLDRRESALAELPNGKVAIVPGKPQQSELLRRITAHDADERMPPADSKLTLTTADVDVLRRWIAAGAEYTEHWSFAPLPAKVVVPRVIGEHWVRNPIDAFVLARLEAEGLEPASPTSKAAYLRRVSLGLTGLPPSARELDALLQEREEAAAAVDRLLASPRYGERMASDWLDVARYADTFGYQNDVERPVWPWRDWVVRAFNDNLPYDQFASWQIAGDLLPDASRDQILATAFQRLHRQTNEGGSVEEEMRLEYVADRTETFSTAFLGLTVACARCHDHKFDPLPTRDYYALSAFFDNIDESGLYSHFTRSTPTPALALSTQKQASTAATAIRRVATIESELPPLARAREQAFRSWSNKEPRPTVQVRGSVGHFAFESIAESALANRADAAKPGRVADGPRLADGRLGKAIVFDGEDNATFPKVADFDRHQPFTLAFWLRVPTSYERAVVLHRSMAWTDAGSRGYELLLEQGHPSFALVHFWPGNATRIRGRDALPVGRWCHVVLTYDGSSRASGMAMYLGGQRAVVDVVRDNLTRSIKGGGAKALTLAQRFRDRGLAGGAVDELQVFDRELSAIEIAHVHGEVGKQTVERLREYYLTAVDDEYRAKLDELREARLALGKIRDAEAEIMVMREMAEPRPTYVRPRGSYLEQGERVGPGTPACLPPLPQVDKPDRLALARWLTDSSHPLTARVAVNRAWQMHFGVGLVATAEDFGSQGRPPSHPQLLDWLARWFVDSGWDLKALHRLIVTSATYRQASMASPALRDRDPENRLLARGPRFQLSAEMIRDQALWAAGLLVERRGGPPVKPYQPAGLWKEKSGQTYKPAKGDGLYRRSLYTYWKRTSPPPSMMTLDAAKRDVCVMRRQRTSTPLQALVLLNDPQYVEAARVLAEGLLGEAGDDVQRIGRAFRRLTSRSPHPSERAILDGALGEARATFAEAPERAAALVAVGDQPPREGHDAGEVAAWTMVVNMLMNFDEVVTLQ